MIHELETNNHRVPARPRHRGTGFTLIELLTVIAIIGILAAILIPVVGKVRQSAKAVQCVSRLRAIGTASMLFVADNKDLLPTNGERDPFRDTGKGRIYHLLTPYIVPQGKGKSSDTVRGYTHFRCPTTDAKGVDQTILYIYNVMVTRRNSTGTGPEGDKPTPIRFSKVKGPDKTPFGWDRSGGEDSTAVLANPFDMSAEHGKNCNVLYVSGRVAPSDFLNINTPPFYGTMPASVWASNTFFDPLYEGK